MDGEIYGLTLKDVDRLRRLLQDYEGMRLKQTDAQRREAQPAIVETYLAYVVSEITAYNASAGTLGSGAVSLYGAVQDDAGSTNTTTTTGSSTIPAVGASVTLAVGDTSWMTLNEQIKVVSADSLAIYYGIVTVAPVDGTHVTIRCGQIDTGTAGDAVSSGASLYPWGLWKPTDQHVTEFVYNITNKRYPDGGLVTLTRDSYSGRLIVVQDKPWTTVNLSGDFGDYQAQAFEMILIDRTGSTDTTDNTIQPPVLPNDGDQYLIAITDWTEDDLGNYVWIFTSEAGTDAGTIYFSPSGGIHKSDYANIMAYFNFDTPQCPSLLLQFSDGRGWFVASTNSAMPCAFNIYMAQPTCVWALDMASGSILANYLATCGLKFINGLLVGGSISIDLSGSTVTGTLPLSRGGLGITSGTSGGVLYFSGSTTIASSGALTQHSIVLGGGVGGAPAALASLGTNHQVLHGNATGDPTWGAVDLTADVSGILPAANGGTANGFTAFAGPAISTKTFTLPNADATILTDNATVTVTQGGTGAASFTAYSVICGGTTSTGALQNVSGVGTSGQVLTSNGAGALPTWQNASGGLTSPLTTKGDIWVYGSADTRLPVGTDNYMLVAASGNATGLAWAQYAPAIYSSPGGLTKTNVLGGTDYGILYRDSGGPLGTLNPGTTTTVLHGNAAGAASFSAVDLAADVTGNLPVANLNGGTSASNTTFWRGDATWATPSVGSLTVGTTAISGGTSGRILYDNAGALGEYAIPLVVANGGTGATTLTAHGILLGEGTSAVTATAAMTDGQLLVGQTSADPLPKTITGDVTISAAGATAIGSGKVTEAMQVLADNTTGNVSSTKHGYAPKSPADATTFLNGAATPAYAQVKDSDLSTSDITTNNVSTTKHGFAPKLPNDATKYLDGTGAYTVPAGGGGSDTFNYLATDFTGSSTTFADVTGLSFSIGANEVWDFEIVLQTGTTSGGFQFQMTGPASPTFVNITVIGLAHEGMAAFSTGTTNTYASAINNDMILLQGMISNGSNSGTVQLQYKSMDIMGGSQKFLAGSLLRATKRS